MSENKKIFEVMFDNCKRKNYTGTADECCEQLKQLFKEDRDIIYINIENVTLMEIKDDSEDMDNLDDNIGIPTVF